MPEEENTSSGTTPGEQRPGRRPTVIRSVGAPPQETPTAAKPKVKPTVMVNTGPTAFPVHEASAPAPASFVAKPTCMPGTIRQRIPVTLAELQKKQAQIQQPVLEEALRLLQGFSPDIANDETAIYWGHETQKRNSEIASRSLALSQSEIVTTTSRHIARMVELLGLVRLEKVFETGSGFFANMFRAATHDIDTPKELEEAMREIGQIVSLVTGSIQQLLDLKTKVEALSTEVEKICTEAQAASIAADCIADYFTGLSRPDLAQRFTERSMSLTATIAQIQSGSSIRSIQIEQPLQLINIVQNVVLVTLPGLIGDIAAMQTMMQGSRKPTPTQISELSGKMKSTLQILKV